MKRFASLILCVILTAILCSCGGGGSTQQPAAPAEGGGETAAADFEPVTLKFATQHQLEHMAHASAEAIKEKIEAETEGRVIIELYPAGQLGDYMQIYEEVMRGTIQIAHITANEQFDQRTTVNFLPGIAYDYESLEKAFGPGSYLSGRFEEIMAEQGIKFMGFYCEGMIGTGTKVPVNGPVTFGEDKGLLVRVSPMELANVTALAYGYRTTSIPYSDVYSAIQTGVVDGWIGGTPSNNYLSFRDVIKYYYHNNIFCETTNYLINQKVFDSLLPQDQEVLLEAFGEQVLASFNGTKEEDEKYMQLLRDEGVEVVTFSPEELEAAAKEVREAVWPQLAPSYTEELVNGLREALE